MRKIWTLIGCFIILIGVGAMCYPSFANFINQKYAVQVIQKYQENVDNREQTEIDGLIGLANQYNKTLPNGYPADPFTGDNISEKAKTEFKDFFMLKPEAMIGYLEIPSQRLYLPIKYGTSESALSESCGLVENSSLPVGGKGTHAVIAGHSGMASTRNLSDIDKLKKGEMFFVHVLDRHYAYKVDKISVILPDETDELQLVNDKDYVTLVTCTPFGVNDHRLLVRGERVEYEFSEDKLKLPALGQLKDTGLWIFILSCAGSAALLICIIALIVKFSFRKKHK